MTFKQGDKVRVRTDKIFEDLGENEPGMIGVFINNFYSRDRYPITVEMDGVPYVYNEDHLELAPSELIKQKLGVK